MSLQTYAPVLDDRDYARIVSEAKSLIPRYTSEWTNLNESDPGITMIELFAWMTEMTLYRLNQTPERNYIKFLELLGIELNPPLPARADLTFTLSRKDVDTVIVPKGARISAQSEGGDPVMFETDEALIALGATLKTIQVFDGYSYSIETVKNQADSQWFYPFGAKARAGSALMLGFDSPLSAFTKNQIGLMAYLREETRARDPQPCAPETLPLAAQIVWEFWDGKRWMPLSMDKDGSRAFTRNGRILLRGPGDKAKKDKLGQSADLLFWIRARLASSEYENSPQLDSISINTISATQAITVKDEIVGGSTGRPNQILKVASTPVIMRDPSETATGADGKPVHITTIRLEIAENKDEFKVWREVEDFLASGPDDPHFVFNRTTGEIKFGDGLRGRIPVANADNPSSNIVARNYRYGGTKAGNVSAGAINQLQTFVPNVDSATNLRPASGGTDEETLDAAKQRAPRELKSKGRAVTSEDFETLAMSAPGARVRRAKALPLAHPKFPGTPIPGVVSVIVVSDSDAADPTEAPNPSPNRATIAAVCAWLNKARLLTCEVYVVPPEYHLVELRGDIVVRPEYDLAEVKQALDNKMLRYFHPLVGGEDGQGWEFGHDIFYSDVYRAILQVPGVDRVLNNQLEIWLDGARSEFCRDVPLKDGALVYATGHQFTVTYGA